MIKLIRSLAELKALAPEWNALPGARRNPLLTHEWIYSAAEQCHAEAHLYIPAWRRENRLAAVAPLVMARRHGIARLEFIGSARLYEPAGFLYEDLPSLRGLCQALRASGHPLMLRRIAIPDESPDSVVPVLREQGYAIRSSTSASPYLVIQTSWEQYFGSLSSRRRYDLRRARRRLEDRGEVSIEIRIASQDTLPDLIDQAFRVESSGWKGQRGSGLTVNSRLRNFFLSYATRACRLGILRLCFLNVGGVPISTQVAVQYANRWWVLKIGYDEQWADCSPGMQLTMETVRHAFESGLEAYEFLGSPESWIRIWTQKEHNYASLDCYPGTMSGIGARAVDTLTRLPRRLLATLKPVADSRETGQM